MSDQDFQKVKYDIPRYIRQTGKNVFMSLGAKKVKPKKRIKISKVCPDCGEDFLTYTAERCFECQQKAYRNKPALQHKYYLQRKAREQTQDQETKS